MYDNIIAFNRSIRISILCFTLIFIEFLSIVDFFVVDDLITDFLHTKTSSLYYKMDILSKTHIVQVR